MMNKLKTFATLTMAALFAICAFVEWNVIIEGCITAVCCGAVLHWILATDNFNRCKINTQAKQICETEAELEEVTEVCNKNYEQAVHYKKLYRAAVAIYLTIIAAIAALMIYKRYRHGR